jgi:ABC-type uncharacterized transport system permease subunit
MQTYLFLIAALLYLGCAVLPARAARAVALGTLLAWLAHAATLWADLVIPGSLRVGFAMMLSAALWVSVALFWLENRNFALDSMRALVLPCAALAVVLPWLFPGSVVSLAGKSGLYGWHIAISVLAYSTLTMAAFHAILMAVQESRLHTRGGGGDAGEHANWFWLALERLPALLTMEKVLFRMIRIGFALLTLTVLSGVVFSEQLLGKALRFDHKTVLALLSWLVFGALLAGRHFRGWRGRTALSWMLAGFAMLVLAYVGSRFVLEVILHRGAV